MSVRCSSLNSFDIVLVVQYANEVYCISAFLFVLMIPEVTSDCYLLRAVKCSKPILAGKSVRNH